MKCIYNCNEDKTRMHSSRMRTVRCSGRLGGVCLGGVCPGLCVSLEWGVCPEGGVFLEGCLPRDGGGGVCPVDRILDTRL